MRLQASNITLSIDGKDILQRVSVELQPGTLLGLIGPNGAGKTSLLRVLANLQAADSGEVLLDGGDIDAVPRKQLAKTLGYLAQGAPAHWPLQVERLVELGRLPHRSPWQTLTGRDREVVKQAMAQAEVEHLKDRIVSTLSGGERLRVLMARMFSGEPAIILADEPIAALDPYHQLHTMELLREHCERGGSGVVVLHDLNMASRFCHRLALMDNGKIVSNGSPQQVLNEDALAAVYGIRAQLIQEHDGLTVIPQQRL